MGFSKFKTTEKHQPLCEKVWRWNPATTNPVEGYEAGIAITHQCLPNHVDAVIYNKKNAQSAPRKPRFLGRIILRTGMFPTMRLGQRPQGVDGPVMVCKGPFSKNVIFFFLLLSDSFLRVNSVPDSAADETFQWWPCIRLRCPRRAQLQCLVLRRCWIDAPLFRKR